MPDDVTLRPARREDAPVIARLFLISSDGLAEYIWARLGMAGRTPEEVGAARYARDDGEAFSYRNCTVAERGGAVVGMVHSYPMDRPETPEEESDPVLRPYAELEDYGSLYISSVAVLEGHRGQGLGHRLLDTAHAHAEELGRPRVSLICMDRNEGAMRLYRRLGYRELDRRAIVPHPCLHYTEGDALLLARPIALNVAS